MGYRTWVDYAIRLVDKTKSGEFKKEMFRLIKEEGYFEKYFLVIDDGFVGFAEELSSGERDAIDCIFPTLARYVEGTIHLSGEDDDDKVLIEFDGKGNFEIKFAKIIYGQIFDEFMDRYDGELTKKLKRELKKWWLAKTL